MAVQDSTFNTAHVLDNEIVKANDFEFAFEKIAENVSRATQMILESNQDFVINGKVLPYQGMNVKVSPIYGVCKSTGVPFGRTEEAIMEYGFEESTSGRVDIIEVRGEWETYDNQQRAFNDPDTNVQTYQYVDTKKLMRPAYRIKKGVEGSSVAPEVDDGYVKLAEVVIRANNSTITDEDIKNITADIAGLANDDWTTEPDITYNIGYISDVNERFRVQHNEDGTHKDNVIDTDSLNIGTGAKQVNGNVLPIGNTVTIPEQTTSSSDTIFATISKVVTVLTSLYNTYLKYGDYGFKGELSVSDIVDADDTLVKPITIKAAGDGTAVIKIDGNAVLSIDANGKLSTNGYTATANNNLVTKAVTDAISNSLNTLAGRVTAVEQTLASNNEYVNNVLSTGTGGRYKVDDANIYLATTGNVTLTGTQSSSAMDNVTSLADGVYILVMKQTDPTQNGIWQYSSNSAWGRVTAYNSPESLTGKLFNVANGAVNAGKIFYMAKVDFEHPETFGTEDIEFSEYFGSIKSLGNHLVMRDSNGDIYGRTFVGTACFSCNVCVSSASSNSDFKIPMIAVSTGLTTATMCYSGSCALTFNPSTGVLKAKTFCGALSGNASTATSATSATCADKGKNGSSYSDFGSNAFNSNSYLLTTGCAADSGKLGGRTAAQFIRNCNGVDLGVNAALGTYHTMTQSGPSSCWNHLLSMGWGECAGTDTWAAQISVPSHNSAARMSYRCHCNNSTNNSWQAWRELIDSAGGQTISGTLTATTFCGALAGCACCAGRNGSGVAFGTAATCAAGCFLSATGCAADSAKLGGTAASSYLKTNGCAADSAKLGGTAASGYAKITSGKFGNACWSRQTEPRLWTVWTVNTTANCDLWKAICCAMNGITKISDGQWVSVFGRVCAAQSSDFQTLYYEASQSCRFRLANVSGGNNQDVYPTSTTVNICNNTFIGGTY